MRYLKIVTFVFLMLFMVTAYASESGVATKWDYKIVTFQMANDKIIEGSLKKYGEDGWELVQITKINGSAINLIFKKPI